MGPGSARRSSGGRSEGPHRAAGTDTSEIGELVPRRAASRPPSRPPAAVENDWRRGGWVTPQRGAPAASPRPFHSLPRTTTAQTRSARQSTRRAWFRLGRERPVLEREAIPAPAALHRVARLRVLRQSDDTLAIGAAHPVGDRGYPAVPIGPHPEGKARSVRAVDHVAGTGARRHGDLLAAVRASHDVGSHRSRRRFSFPRSNPTTTSSPTVMTGTAIRPVLAISSSRAAASSATFFAVNAMP